MAQESTITTHNDLKKGIRVVMTPFRLISDMPRTGVLMDNMKGITRLIHIDETQGYYPDMGSVYIDEILAYIPKGREITDLSDIDELFAKLKVCRMSDAHTKKMKRIRELLGS